MVLHAVLESVQVIGKKTIFTFFIILFYKKTRFKVFFKFFERILFSSAQNLNSIKPAILLGLY